MNQPRSDERGAGSSSAKINWSKIATAILLFAYLFALIGLIYDIRTWGDRTTAATILLFSPRWLFTMPLILFIPLAIWLDRRLLFLSGVAAAVALFGLLGFSLGWRRMLPSSSAAGPAIRVLTFNTHYNALSVSGLAAYIQETKPDVVALEEWWGGSMPAVFNNSGWHYVRCDDNALASRFQIQENSVRWGDAFFHCTVLLPSGPVDVAVLHLHSPHVALRDAVEASPDAPSEIRQNILWRSRQAAAIHGFAQKQKLPFLLLGDFNLVPDSIIYRENFSDLSDAFEAGGFGFGYSYINRWTRVRIDHVLMNDSFRCEDCFVGPFLGSPHRPVVADLIPLRRS